MPSIFSHFSQGLLGEAGESVLKMHRAPQRSQDETLIISISPEVIRGSRKESGEEFSDNPKRVRPLRKNPELKITHKLVQQLHFWSLYADIYITMTTESWYFIQCSVEHSGSLLSQCHATLPLNKQIVHESSKFINKRWVFFKCGTVWLFEKKVTKSTDPFKK